MSGPRSREPAVIQANLTPMIDVNFLLLIFFIHETQINHAGRTESTQLEPVDPAASAVTALVEAMQHGGGSRST